MSGPRKETKMSPLFGWRGKICMSDLAPTTRLLALVLSLHMNELGSSCYPGSELLARETGLSSSTVFVHLAKLRDAGWITVGQPRGSGRGHVNLYSATVPESHREPDTSDPVDNGESVRLADESVREPDRKPPGAG